MEERIAGNPFLHPEVAYEWTYGAVYNPKWIKGLTLSADWWHIDMRDIVAPLGAQFIIQNSNRAPFDALVIRAAPPPGGEFGPVILVQDPSANIAGAIFEGLDYEAIYILDSSIFGHGDFGRLTTTVNGTWLSRAELQPSPISKRFGINGQFQSTSFTLTSSLPWHRANFSIFYDGPADTWAGGLDVGAVVHWTGQFEDDNFDLTLASKPQEPRSGDLPNRARKVAAWTTLDLILNYTFNLPPKVKYPCAWETRRVRNRGHIKWQGRERFVGRAFVGQLVGLNRVAKGIHEVYLDHHLIGLLYERDPAGMRPASIARHP